MNRPASGDASRLAQLQRWMQAVVTHPGGVADGLASNSARCEIALGSKELDRVILPSLRLPAADRLGVYANAYFARLLGCLRELFPALHFALGGEPFDALALAYLQRHPSTSYSLGHLAGHFGDYLEETRPRGGDAPGIDGTDLVVDLARLESAIDEVFDGPGEEGSPVPIAARLAQIPQDQWPTLRLKVSRSLRLLELRYPLDSFYSAARAQREADWPVAAPSYLAIWRREFVVRRWEIPREAFRLLKALAEGARLAEALAQAAESCAENSDFVGQVPAWFRDWGAAGILVDIEPSGAVVAKTPKS